MPGTLERMARKKHAEEGESAPKLSTDAVRIESDLARMLAIISAATGRSIAEIISPQLRPFVERLYDETVTKLPRRPQRPPAKE